MKMINGRMKLILSVLISLVALSSAFADGFIVLPNPVSTLRTPYPLEVRSHHVDVSIDGLAAETSIDQEFVNPTNYRFEGYYIFPIPKGALINKFTMEIDGKETEAELLDAAKARTIYEDIVRKQLDPALLEYSERSIFKVRIFPIEPRSKKRIKIRYSETLSIESGSVEYVYPLNTEKFSSKNLEDVRVTVSLKSDSSLGPVFCPTHQATITREGATHAVVTYEERNVTPDRDFKLLFSNSETKVGSIFRAYRDGNDDGFFFINASPFINEHPEVIDRDVVFALDTSGSMAGENLDSAKRALRYCVKNLNRGDRFQIVRFSTEADSLFDTVSANTSGNITKAEKYIDGFRAIGGTNIEEALRRSIESLPKDGRPKVIIFITDGKPTLGETDDDKLLASVKKLNYGMTRIFTFGVGYDINTHLLDRITEATRAYRTYISPKEDIESAVSAFYNKIQSPVLTDLSIKITGVKNTKIYPKDLPDLYAGSSLSVFGRYSGDGNSVITLEGKIKGKVQRFSYPVVFPSQNPAADFIPPLWASRRVGYLLDQMRLYGNSKEVIDEIVSLARTYGILTPYTSYLILEDEARKTEQRELPDDRLSFTNALPAPQVMKEYKKGFSDMKSSSGAGSVEASRSLQELSDMDNADKAKKQQSRAVYQSGGQTKRVADKTRTVNGITFYQSGQVWNDSRLTTKKNLQSVKIKFASDDYFALLDKEPSAKGFMSIGQNVRFLIGDTLYEISN
ncbi:MAG TPA: VIT domain-containing protein [Spirochaetota bacterium]